MSADQQFLTKANNKAKYSQGTALNLLNPLPPQQKVLVQDATKQQVIIPAHQVLTVFQNSFDIDVYPNTAVNEILLNTGGVVDISIPKGGGGGTIDRCLIEFDITNSTRAACTLVLAPLLLHSVEILTGGGSVSIQTIPGDHLFTDLAYLSTENLTAFAGYINSTNQLETPTTVADAGVVSYTIPILSCFLEQSHFYLPTLKGGIIFHLNFRPASDTVVAEAAPTLSNLCIHLHRNALLIKQVPAVMNFYQSNTQDF
jgi:hypothetical protein